MAETVEGKFERRELAGRDGLRLIADVGGRESGPEIVLLHGGGQTRHSWQELMRRLVDRGFHVTNFDARGHGESDWSPEGDYSIRAMADDLEAILSTLRHPRALVGASMGGISSYYSVGRTDNSSADALVLVDIVPRPSMEGAMRIRNFMAAHLNGFATLEDAVDAVAEYNPQRPRAKDPSGLMRNLRLRDDGRLYWHWDPRFMTPGEGNEPPILNEDMIQLGRRIAIPTLVLRGSRSDVVTDAQIEEMRSLVPHTEVFDVAGASHMVVGDRNDIFATAVIDFLTRHLDTGAIQPEA